MSLAERVRRRLARAPEPVRAVVDAAADDERVLAHGELAGGGWLVATSVGLRVVDQAGGEPVAVLRWHEVGSARWKAVTGGGGSFVVTPLTEVEPGVQSRLPEQRHVLTDAGELPGVVRRRVDQTVVTSRRTALPGGGSALLVARRLPGQAAREWTVVFDTDGQRTDPEARAAAREKLAEAVAAETPA